MTHAKNTPRTPTKERPNMVHLDAIRFITFRRPERMMTQNGRVTSILICLHQSKTTNRRNREERFKIDIIINSHISPPPFFFTHYYRFNENPRPVLTRTQSKSIKILIFLFTPIFFRSMFLTLRIFNVLFKKDA